jgi:two-component system, NarL family, nitrate/nitrite response regulator NarL
MSTPPDSLADADSGAGADGGLQPDHDAAGWKVTGIPDGAARIAAVNAPGRSPDRSTDGVRGAMQEAIPLGSDAPLRIRLHAADPVRRQGLAAMLQTAGHLTVEDSPDVALCDGTSGLTRPKEDEAPVLLLAARPPRGEQPAGLLSPDVTAAQLDVALRAVAAGLVVRSPGMAAAPDGFDTAEEIPPLTPRESEILALVGQGLSNKAVARRLGISFHTVKFHLEALFAKLEATSRAEAVAKGLRGGAIDL